MWDSPSYKKMCFHPTHPEEGEQDHVWHFTHVCVIMLVTWRVHEPRRWILPLFPTWTRLLRLNERSRDARGQHVTHEGGVVYSKTVEFTVSLLKQPMCLSFRSRPFVLFSQSIIRLGCFVILPRHFVIIFLLNMTLCNCFWNTLFKWMDSMCFIIQTCSPHSPVIQYLWFNSKL